MLRMFRSGSRPGSPSPAVRILAVLIAVGLLVSIAPFVGTFVVGLVDLL